MTNATDPRQLALFSLGAVPNLWTRDLRSVGELLADTDLQSRQLLHDMVLEDAPAMLVAWPKVLAAADGLWKTFPSAPTRVAAEAEQRVMDLLIARGNGYLHALHQARAYVGDVAPDCRLSEIAETIDRAGTLVGKFGGEVDAEREPARSELKDARARVLHTLFLTIHAAHAAVRLLRNGVMAGRVDPVSLIPGLQNRSAAEIGEVLDDWTHRLGSTEAAVGRALKGMGSHAVHDEVGSDYGPALRLPRALATWELGTHRVLATTASPADLALIARCESLITATAYRLHVHWLDPQTGDIERDCEAAAAGWAKAATWWNLLTEPGVRANRHLVAAAAELRAAVRELTLDHAHLADPAIVTGRPGYSVSISALLAALEDSREVARIVIARALDQELLGPARALSRRAQDLCEETPMDRDAAWVTPREVMENRMVPLPHPIRNAMLADASALERAAQLTASAAIQAGALDTRLVSQGSSRSQNIDEEPATKFEIDPCIGIGR